MSDKFFTLMVVPEKSDRIRKFTVPALYLKALAGVGAVLCFLGILLVFDYLHVLGQVSENKKLRLENHVLKTDIQTAKAKLESLDQSVTRLKSFANKLRVISNLDNPGSQRMLQQVPELPNGQPQPGGNPMESEDSGRIEDPDRHSRLEKFREATVLGELGQGFEADDLLGEVNRISEGAVKLKEVAEDEERTLADLQEQIQERLQRLLSTPSVMPAMGWISSEFGTRFNPFSGVRTFHAGIDIANRPGTSIHAPADGVVTNVGVQGGFGQVVRIDHGYGVVTKYGHNSRILAKPGQRVKRGDKVAEMGSSGRSTGPHLHYQVEVNGRPVNPRLFILEESF
jgi:murein DD-endopeptidase MepM/ murein hydrolase activator NlpD